MICSIETAMQQSTRTDARLLPVRFPVVALLLTTSTLILVLLCGSTSGTSSSLLPLKRDIAGDLFAQVQAPGSISSVFRSGRRQMCVEVKSRRVLDDQEGKFARKSRRMNGSSIDKKIIHN